MAELENSTPVRSEAVVDILLATGAGGLAAPADPAGAAVLSGAAAAIAQTFRFERRARVEQMATATFERISAARLHERLMASEEVRDLLLTAGESAARTAWSSGRSGC